MSQQIKRHGQRAAETPADCFNDTHKASGDDINDDVTDKVSNVSERETWRTGSQQDRPHT